MPLPSSYATAGDLANYWRPLSSAEQARATFLLGAAADRINEFPSAANFVQTACKWVSLDMVKRAMMVSGDGETNESQSMAGMTVNRVFANPMGNLYITPKEVARLKGRYGPTAFSVTPSSNARVSLEPWNYQQSSQVLPVEGITVTPDPVALSTGGAQPLQVLAAACSEYEDRTDDALYTSSDPSIAAVDSAGRITGIAPGSVTVTVTYLTFTAHIPVTVS